MPKKQVRNSIKQTAIRALPVILLMAFLTFIISGCATTSVYVLDKEEIVKAKAGEPITPKFDGWLLSQRAVNRVMNSKIADINLK